MTTAAETKPLTRTALQLAPGDVALLHGQPAEVLFTQPYTVLEWRWVLVVYRTDGMVPVVEHHLADTEIPLQALAADDGFGYSREVDDPAPVSPARVPLHTGSVVADGVLVTDPVPGERRAAGLVWRSCRWDSIGALLALADDTDFPADAHCGRPAAFSTTVNRGDKPLRARVCTFHDERLRKDPHHVDSVALAVDKDGCE